jgi:hypothetical protein
MDTLRLLASITAAGEVLPGISVFLTLPQVVGLLFSAVLIGFCFSAAARHRTGRAAAFGLGAIALLVALAATSLLATPAAWQVLHAAYRDASPEKQHMIGQDIAAKWLPFHEGMVLGDYSFSRGSGACVMNFGSKLPAFALRASVRQRALQEKSLRTSRVAANLPPSSCRRRRASPPAPATHVERQIA